MTNSFIEKAMGHVYFSVAKNVRLFGVHFIPLLSFDGRVMSYNDLLTCMNRTTQATKLGG